MKLNSVKTAGGKIIALKTVNGDVMVNNVHVIKADIAADNGTIHGIDRGALARMKLIRCIC